MSELQLIPFEEIESLGNSEIKILTNANSVVLIASGLLYARRSGLATYQSSEFISIIQSLIQVIELAGLNNTVRILREALK